MKNVKRLLMIALVLCIAMALFAQGGKEAAPAAARPIAEMKVGFAQDTLN